MRVLKITINGKQQWTEPLGTQVLEERQHELSQIPGTHSARVVEVIYPDPPVRKEREEEDEDDDDN